MLSRSFAVTAESRQSHLPSRLDSGVQPNRIPKLVSVAALMCFCLTMLILGVMIAGRTGTLRQLLDPPSRFLPGNPLPNEVSCNTHSNEYVPRCYAQHLDDEFYFVFDADTRTIIRTVIPAREYTIGQLILAWGTPIGITQTNYTIDIDWRTRSALLYSSSFQPDSRVEFILYGLEQQPTSPWRGFRRRITRSQKRLIIFDQAFIFALLGTDRVVPRQHMTASQTNQTPTFSCYHLFIRYLL